MRLFGLSDLHVDYAANLDTVKHLQRPAGEGHLALIIAGDVTADRGTLRERRRTGAAIYVRRRLLRAGKSRGLGHVDGPRRRHL